MAEKTSLRARYRRAFIAGLGALLPTILTIAVIHFSFTFIRDTAAEPINSMIRAGLRTGLARDYYWAKLRSASEEMLDEKPETVDALGRGAIPFSEPAREGGQTLVGKHVPWWIGFTISIVIVFFVGNIIASYLGRRAWRSVEGRMIRLPVVRTIYPYAKQITEFFFAEKKTIRYERVVAVEYPRKGIYSMGFITGEGLVEVVERTERRYYTIFIPSSPTPVTGYTIMVPQEDVIPLPMTADQVFRFVISGGVIVPPHLIPAEALKTRKVPRQVAEPPSQS